MSDATVTIASQPVEVYLNGAPGQSAYDLWIAAGNTGTISDFLAATGAAALSPLALVANVEFSGASGTASTKAEQSRVRMSAANVLTFSGMTIYLQLGAGVLFGYAPAGGLVGSYTFADDDRLLMTRGTDNVVRISQVNVGAAQPAGAIVVLAHFKAGKFCGGILMDLIADELREQLMSIQCLEYLTLATADSYFDRNPLPIVTANVLSFNNAILVAAGVVSNTKTSYQFGGGSSGFTGSWAFTPDGDEYLIWDVAANTIARSASGTPQPWKCVILLHWKHNRFISGALLPHVLQGNPPPTGPVESSENRALVFTGKNVGQDVTIARGKLYSFEGAPASESPPSVKRVWVYTASLTDGFPYLGQMTHNLGHCGGLDYAPETDTLAATGAGIYLIPSWSGFALGSFIDTASTPMVTIGFAQTRGDGTIKLLDEAFTNGAGIGALIPAFAGRKDMLWCLADNGCYYRVLLGLGANDLSDKTTGLTDYASWGTFITGKGANEYNGTARILSGVVSSDPISQKNAQGICTWQGAIMQGISRYAPQQACEVQRLRVDYRSIAADRSFRYEAFDATGAIVQSETEGVAILDGLYLLAAASGTFVVFPLANEQGGKGVIGAGGAATITLPFAANSAPHVGLHPTSAGGASCYVSAVDPVAGTFTVTGPVGATFNWSAPIS